MFLKVFRAIDSRSASILLPRSLKLVPSKIREKSLRAGV